MRHIWKHYVCLSYIVCLLFSHILFSFYLWYKAGMYHKRKENIYLVKGISGSPRKGGGGQDLCSFGKDTKNYRSIYQMNYSQGFTAHNHPIDYLIKEAVFLSLRYAIFFVKILLVHSYQLLVVNHYLSYLF